MRRGRALLLTTVGIVVVAAVVAIAVIQARSGSSPATASGQRHPGASTAATQAGAPTPVVAAPKRSGAAALSYLADMKPSGDFAQMVNPGPVAIAGSTYPRSISFYCNVGDPTAFPEYRITGHARRFDATIGLPPGSSSDFRAGIMIDGDGRTLRMVTVSVARPKTVDVSVRGVHVLRLECFGSGNSATGGEAVAVAFGNARVAEKP